MPRSSSRESQAIHTTLVILPTVVIPIAALVFLSILLSHSSPLPLNSILLFPSHPTSPSSLLSLDPLCSPWLGLSLENLKGNHTLSSQKDSPLCFHQALQKSSHRNTPETFIFPSLIRGKRGEPVSWGPASRSRFLLSVQNVPIGS